MNKSSRSEAFGEQMAQAMAELRATTTVGQVADGRWPVDDPND